MVSRILKGLLFLIAVFALIYVVLALLAQPAEAHRFFTEGPARSWVIAHQGLDATTYWSLAPK